MLGTSYASQVFLGVHFALFGFNPITASKVRFKLVNGGGIDVGKYSASCTHVVVDEVAIAYDDPVCVAARYDGKTVVTALWVEHSADIGMPVNADSVIYRPLKDLNGIPGAKNLVVCLTGYQRQDRDDIMTMVGLMGAEFCKPLVANRVTHLICYKFEGEKYELAKRMGTIKLVNHRWLEDCLKDWALLPEDNYNRSGYELEMMAKDSEDEAEDSKLGESGGRNISKSPLCSKFEIGTSHGLSKSPREASNAFPGSTGPLVLPKNKGKESSIIQENKSGSDKDLSSSYVDDKKVSSEAPDVSIDATSCQPETNQSKNAGFPKVPSCEDLGTAEKTNSHGLVSALHASTSEPRKLVTDMRSSGASAEKVAHSDAKISTMSYSRKNQRGFTLPRSLNECLGNETGPIVSPLADLKFGNNLETPSSNVEKGSEGIKSTCVEGSGIEPTSVLPQKRTNEASSNKSKSRKMNADAKLSNKKTLSAKGKSQGVMKTSLVDEPPNTEGYSSAGNDGLYSPNTSSISKPAASTFNSLEFDEPFSRNASSKSAQCDNACQNSADKAAQSLTEPKINGKLDITGHGMGQVDGNEAEQRAQNLEHTSPGNNSGNAESTGPTNLDLSYEENNKLTKKSLRKKTVAKRSLGSTPNAGATTEQKISASLNKTIQQGEAASFPSGIEEIATRDAEKLPGSPHIPAVNKSMDQKTVTKYAEDAGGRLESLDDETEAPDDKCVFDSGMALDENKFSNKKSRNEESAGPTNLDFSSEESNKLTKKPLRKKTVAKKCLGSRPKAGATTEQKISASLNKTIQQGEAASFSSGIPEIPTRDAVKLQNTPEIPDVNKSMKQNTASKYAEDAGGRPESLDDETEAPDDKCGFESGMALDENKFDLFNLSNKADEITEEKSEAIQHITKCEEAKPEKEGINATEKRKTPSRVDSTAKSQVKKDQVRKPPAARAKKTAVGKKLMKTKEAISKEWKHESEMENIEMSPPADTSNSPTAQTKTSEDLIEEKENRPVDDGELHKVEGKSVGNQTIKPSTKKPAKTNNSKKVVLNPSISEAKTTLKNEAATCFIFSGHRLQRKEFQQVIKRLKGRVSRDSHQWSYQATHFVAPEPIKRTEKFFAAAASGRWILKTDFLTASSQAGKLLPEEPYEWHKNGLNEDGAIDLEAPRKWRLLRERTGHGAFYGMRIIVYGDCINPPLDTLKRVVKAGDGTILATSPPYTRFLDTEVDYAVISPGMPRVDMWVQEFLNHEIPCVAADYLVEYICKPGHSLESHVLYDTHDWAAKSHAKLQSRAEEIEIPLTPEDCCTNDDIICQICGSRDRGDVMLICGDESGSVGCGVGTHIDCCDPPLEDVPEEDWFCPKCSGSSTSTTRKRKNSVLSSLSKRKK